MSRKSVDLLMSGREPLFVSVVSAWEYGQKRRKFPSEFPSPFDAVVDGFPYTPLPLAFELHRFAEDLPALHADPFDRMLIAQALHHGLTLVASDEQIHAYPVPIFW